MSQWTMNKDFRDKWLKALRSGKYEQTECYLATETYDYGDANDAFAMGVSLDTSATKGYCCLGVACAVAGVSFSDMVEIGTPAELILELKHQGEDGFAVENIYDKAPILLGESIDEDKGIDQVDSSFIDRLVYMNDDQKNSFNEIADYIERRTKGI